MVVKNEVTFFVCVLQDNECVPDCFPYRAAESRSSVCWSDVLETRYTIREAILYLSRRT